MIKQRTVGVKVKIMLSFLWALSLQRITALLSPLTHTGMHAVHHHSKSAAIGQPVNLPWCSPVCCIFTQS